MNEEQIQALVNSIPDYPTATYGFKTFRLRAYDPTRLVSTHYQSWTWYPRESYEPMKAVCAPGYQQSAAIAKHEPPAPEGVHTNYASFPCGFYAHYFMEDLIRMETPIIAWGSAGVYSAKIAAVVQGYGKVEAHLMRCDGWRSEYLRIAALCRPTHVPEKPELQKGVERVFGALAEIADALGIPLIDQSEAEEFGQSLGVCLAPEHDLPPEPKPEGTKKWKSD